MARHGAPRREGEAALAAALGACVLASMLPMWQGRMPDANGVAAYPSSLRATAQDIDADARTRGGTTLVLPSARSATYTWGTSSDEPLVAFAASPVAQRASAPLVHPGAQRLMGAVDQAVASGRDLPTVADALARAGVSRVVIRHGLTPAQQTTSPMRYVTALDTVPTSFTHHRVHGTGDERYDVYDVTATSATMNATTSDAGARDATTALTPARQSVGVLGGPESTLSLARAGVRSDVAYETGRSGGWITDDVRRRVYNNGRPASVAFGPTLSAHATSDEIIGARDLDFPGRRASWVTREFTGVDSATSSASTADPFAATYDGPGAGAASALDDDPATAWFSALEEPGTLRLGWAKGSPARTLTLTTAALRGAAVTGVTVRVDGRAGTAVPAGPHRWRVEVPAGTRYLDLEVTGRGASTAAVGIADIDDSRGELGAILRLPGSVMPASSGIVLTRSSLVAAGAALRTEDGDVMTRRLTVAHPGIMNVDLTVKDGLCREGDLVVRGGGGSWQPVTLSGCRGTVNLPAGTVDLKARVDVESVALTPTSADARRALGLNGGDRTDSPPAVASTQGANAGWAAPTTLPSAHPVTLDGWRQGFTLASTDANAASRGDEVRPLTMHFAPQRLHTLTLVIGGLCAVACLLVATMGGLLPKRRHLAAGVAPGRAEVLDDVGDLDTAHELDHGEDAPRAGARTRRGAAIVVAAAGVISLTGWWGVPIMAVAVLAPRRVMRHAVAGMLVVTGPTLAFLGVVDRASVGALAGQVLAVTALAIFILSSLDQAPSQGEGDEPTPAPETR